MRSPPRELPDGAASAARRGAPQLAATAQAGQLAARLRAHRGRPRHGRIRAGGSRGAHRGPVQQFSRRHGARRAQVRGALHASSMRRCTSIARCGRRSSSTCCRMHSSSRSMGQVSVALGRDGTHAVLEVADTGIGVPEHELPRLFERFHRVEGAQARTHEGSGIGLALVQELVKLHGGSIEAESQPGPRHALFRVRIPFGDAHLPRRATPRHVRRPAPPRSARRPSSRRRCAGCRMATRTTPPRRNASEPLGTRRRSALRLDIRPAHRAGRRQCRHARLRERSGWAGMYEIEAVSDGQRGARGGAPRAAGADHFRRHDAEARRPGAAAGAARRSQAARCAGDPAVGARRRRSAHRRPEHRRR